MRTRPARLLFTTEAGRPIHRATWSHIWRPGREAAGLPVGTGFHALRHYFATLLIFSGASVKTVQLALGHAPTITLNTYAGLWPEQIDRTRALVDVALSLGTTGGGVIVSWANVGPASLPAPFPQVKQPEVRLITGSW